MTVFPDKPVEQALIGGSLLHGRVVVDRLVDRGVLPEHFLDDWNREVWRRVLEASQRDGDVDARAVAALLPDRASEVDALTAHAFSRPESFNTLVDVLLRTALRRRWQEAGYALVEAADQDDERHVQRAEGLLRSEVAAGDDEWSPERLREDVYDHLANGSSMGASTCFRRIDEAIGGLRPGDVSAIGGWTKQGKSLWVDQILAAAARAGLRAHLLTNEMSPRDRALRLIAQRGAAPHDRLLRRSLDERETTAVLKTELPFGLTEVSAWPVDRIARLIRTQRWDIMALDVLHNIPFNDTREFDMILTTLLNAARSSGTHLILVCHLNDARATGATLPPPVLRDFRSSGMIVRVAAAILALHRDQDVGDDGVALPLPTGRMYVLAARHGREAGVRVRLDEESLSFRELVDFGASRLDVAA